MFDGQGDLAAFRARVGDEGDPAVADDQPVEDLVQGADFAARPRDLFHVGQCGLVGADGVLVDGPLPDPAAEGGEVVHERSVEHFLRAPAARRGGQQLLLAGADGCGDGRADGARAVHRTDRMRVTVAVAVQIDLLGQGDRGADGREGLPPLLDGALQTFRVRARREPGRDGGEGAVGQPPYESQVEQAPGARAGGGPALQEVGEVLETFRADRVPADLRGRVRVAHVRSSAHISTLLDLALHDHPARFPLTSGPSAASMECTGTTTGPRGRQLGSLGQPGKDAFMTISWERDTGRAQAREAVGGAPEPVERVRYVGTGDLGTGLLPVRELARATVGSADRRRGSSPRCGPEARRGTPLSSSCTRGRWPRPSSANVTSGSLAGPR